MEINIFVSGLSNRLKYTFNLVFTTILQTPYKFTTNEQEWREYNGPKMVYGNQCIEDYFFVKNKGLLFEQGINESEISVDTYKNTKIIYCTPHNKLFPFDVFSAVFFMASRYEEYLPHKRDIHDRFEATESLAFKEGFLNQAVVHWWCEFLWEELQARFPDIQREKRKFKFITTIDVDNAFAYKQKGFVRSFAGVVKNIIQLNFKQLKERLLVLMSKKQDPYDTFNDQFKWIKQYNLEVIYFILLGDYGYNDKNVPFTSLQLQSLIKSLQDYAKVGIHPSYGSNNHLKQLQKEVDRLSFIIHQEVKYSRQHYLKLKFPSTYRNLIELDILHDYTMGYACRYGFRAGICVPYYFYDLDLEQITKLQIHPFAIMEGTLMDYMRVDTDEALEYFYQMIDEVKAVNGEFISLWHNHVLQKTGEWKPWREIFEKMIIYAQQK